MRPMTAITSAGRPRRPSTKRTADMASMLPLDAPTRQRASSSAAATARAAAADLTGTQASNSTARCPVTTPAMAKSTTAGHIISVAARSQGGSPVAAATAATTGAAVNGSALASAAIVPTEPSGPARHVTSVSSSLSTRPLSVSASALHAGTTASNGVTNTSSVDGQQPTVRPQSVHSMTCGVQSTESSFSPATTAATNAGTTPPVQTPASSDAAATLIVYHRCRWCAAKFRTVKRCNHHEQSCLTRDPGGTCNVCGKVFSRIGNARRHQRTMHAGVMEECHHCGYIAHSAGHMRRHMTESKCASIRGVHKRQQWPT